MGVRGRPVRRPAPDPARYLEEVLLGRYEDAYDRALAARFAELRAERAGLPGRGTGRGWPGASTRSSASASTFQQNCAGLALLRRIKARYPEIHTVMGGANCEGAMGAALHELFPFVDYVCSGEGDRVFPRAGARLLAGESPRGCPGILRAGG